jgi:hypothetical protein
MTYSIYYDLLEPYIEIIKNLWNKIINNFNFLKDSHKDIDSVINDSISQVKNEVKLGIKEGIKEALDETLTEIEMSEDLFKLIKQIALISSGMFFIYFIFILPGSTDTLNQYNWFNQSLIELKIAIKDLLINPVTPSNPGSPNNPTINLDIPKSMVDVGVSPIKTIYPNSPTISEGVSTITPNSPVTSINSNISPIQTVSEYVEASTQTHLQGLQVTRDIVSNETILSQLPPTSKESLKQSVNSIIRTITD